MLRIYLPRFNPLFASYLIALAHAAPVAYSHKNLVDLDRVRASGASEVFYFLPFTYAARFFDQNCSPKMIIPTNKQKKIGHGKSTLNPPAPLLSLLVIDCCLFPACRPSLHYWVVSSRRTEVGRRERTGGRGANKNWAFESRFRASLGSGPQLGRSKKGVFVIWYI